jgi:hypothetical protein
MLWFLRSFRLIIFSLGSKGLQLGPKNAKPIWISAHQMRELDERVAPMSRLNHTNSIIYPFQSWNITPRSGHGHPPSVWTINFDATGFIMVGMTMNTLLSDMLIIGTVRTCGWWYCSCKIFSIQQRSSQTWRFFANIRKWPMVLSLRRREGNRGKRKNMNALVWPQENT